ncbi:MAG: hypothetical protein ACHQYQ_06920 [Bacteriovoracales bacterium]
MDNVKCPYQKEQIKTIILSSLIMINRRKTYLVNPPFQLKFSIMVSFLVFLSSLIFPWAIFDLMNQTIAVFSKIEPAFAPILIERRKTLWIILTMWEIGFLGLIFSITIFFSHKVAGPLFKIKVFLQDLKLGKDHQQIVLRPGDYFQDIVRDVQQTFDYISSEYNKDYIPITEAIKQLNHLKSQFPEDRAESFDKILEKLTEIQDRINRR